MSSLQLSNHLFEELAMDVYDEVDRRETDAGKRILKWWYSPVDGHIMYVQFAASYSHIRKYFMCKELKQKSCPSTSKISGLVNEDSNKMSNS